MAVDKIPMLSSKIRVEMNHGHSGQSSANHRNNRVSEQRHTGSGAYIDSKEHNIAGDSESRPTTTAPLMVEQSQMVQTDTSQVVQGEEYEKFAQ